MALASRGLRDLDTGIESIEEDPERRAVQAQARRILRQSLAWTAFVMVVALLLP